MKNLLCYGMVAAWVVLGHQAVRASDAEAPKPGQRVALFDGKNLDAWEVLKCEAVLDQGTILLKSGNGMVQTKKKSTSRSWNSGSGLAEGGHHPSHLGRGGAIGRHQHHHIADRAREHALARHRFAHPNARPLAQVERLARPPIPNQFDPYNQADLPDVTDVRIAPQRC